MSWYGQHWLATRVYFLDADPGFVHSDGTISHHDMYDYLHLSRLGYTPVCRALHLLLLRLLTQDQGQGVVSRCRNPAPKHLPSTLNFHFSVSLHVLLYVQARVGI